MTTDLLRSLLPSIARRPARAIYHSAFRMSLRARCWLADLIWNARLDIPVPPAMLRFRVGESLSVDNFLTIGSGCANLIRQHLEEMNLNLAHARRVLDFGCGCGRTLRWFLGDDLDAVEFHGVDVDREALDWCEKHLKKGHFLATSPCPPLPYPADFFDVVYCLSVFTHLDESMQDLWLPELMRVLKPGGAVWLTIHGSAATCNLGQDDFQILQTKGFLHRQSTKLKGVVPEWYQTSWHSEAYIIGRVSRWFAGARYRVIPDGTQDVVIARKPAQKTISPSGHPLKL